MTETGKITDLLREKYGISKVSKHLNITTKDDLFSAYRKLAKYLYQNAYANGDLSCQLPQNEFWGLVVR